MHAYRQLIEEQMTARKMTPAELSRASGVTRQRISQILNNDGDRLVQAPATATIEGFAKAFHLEPEIVWTAVAVSMGLPRFVVPSITHQIKDVDDAQLLKELASRLGLEVAVRTTEPTEGEGEKIGSDGGVPHHEGIPQRLDPVEELKPPRAGEDAP